MNLKLGMPTLIEHHSLKESVLLCHELGLDFVELNMNLPQYQVELLEANKELREHADQYGIYYTIHLDENLNVSDFNQAVTNAYVDTVRRTIQVAKNLGVPLLNMHMNEGVYFTLPEKKVYLYDTFKDVYLKRMLEFRKMCEFEIGDDAIVISIENTDGYTLFEKEAIELLLESKVFSLTFDIGHSHSQNHIDESFLLQHKDRLRHFHLHDAVGQRNHLTLGSGEINLNDRLTLAKSLQCSCVIETKTIKALRESVRWLGNYTKNN